MTVKQTQPAIERRFFNSGVELREANTSKSLGMKGYAAKFNTKSQDLGGFIEQIAPGAFAKTILNDDIRLTLNHDANFVLARNKNGTLRLSEDDTGLLVDADMANTSYGQDLAVSMRRGDINQMSFVFQVLRDSWGETPDGLYLRTLQKVELIDVSVVTYPAYLDTEAGLRSLDPLGLAKLDPEQRKQAIKSLVGKQPVTSNLDLRKRRLDLKYKLNK